MMSQTQANHIYVTEQVSIPSGPRSLQQQYQIMQPTNPSRLAVYDPNVQHQRLFVRSPINFREGRRASDGLMSQGPFQQELYDKIKAHGLVELHDVPDKELHTKLEQLSTGSNRSSTSGNIFEVHFAIT